MPRILLLDNYDSFTWNLAHYLEELGANVDVRLNDEVTADRVVDRGYHAWVVSPGPGRPEQAGISLELIRAGGGKVPLLGVCLGHQALAQAHGARIVRAPTLMHGKTSSVLHDGSPLFESVPRSFDAMRYHSLVVDRDSVSSDFEICAETEDGVVMALRHRTLPMHGVQFHPESILTVVGKQLLRNFLAIAAAWKRSELLPARANGGN